MSERGLFVTVEGIDGAGKSTVVEAIDSHFDNTITTSEPSDLWTGEAVYRAIDSDSETPPLTDFFFFMGDRVNHIQNRIEPAVQDGQMVISDRYADSTMAYQPHALRDEMENPKEYMRSLMGEWNMEPDVTIFLDISVDTAIERIDGGDKYEDREFLYNVRNNYHEQIARHADRFEVVDAELPKNHVKNEVVSIIEDER